MAEASFRTVQEMLSSNLARRGEGSIWNAGGYRYQEAAPDASDHHLTTAGGVKLYVLPGDGGYSVMAFGAAGDDATDDRLPILAAIDAANTIGGARITSAPGSVHRYSGRLRTRPGAAIDFGRGGAAAILKATSSDGGVELVAGSSIRAELRKVPSTYTGPMLEISGAKSTEVAFGRRDRAARFDVGMLADRSAGSVGLLMLAEDGEQVSWVEGQADIDEFDYSATLESQGTGYVNENALSLRMYDGVESLRMIVSGSGEVAANRICAIVQTGLDGRSGRALSCDGQRNDVIVTVWDWFSAKIDGDYDGAPILLTAKSGGNRLRGQVGRGFDGFGRQSVIDLAPTIRRNLVHADDQRVIEPDFRPMVPSHYNNPAMIGDQDDELAYAANGRYAVTLGGATPPTSDAAQYLFWPTGNAMSVSNATEVIVTVDLGASRSPTEFGGVGVIIQSTAALPDRIKVEGSADGSTWTTILKAGYDGDAVPLILTRMDGGGLTTMRYVRLTAERDEAGTISIGRMFLSAHGTTKTGGAFLPRYRPAALDGYYVGANKVVGARQNAITNATSGTEVATINAILAAMRAHGLIGT